MLSLLVCGGVTSACGGGGGLIQAGGDPTIFTFHGDGGMDAIVSGRLTYLHDQDCIVLDDGIRRTLAVFPAGSKAHFVADGALQVDMHGYGPLREGVSVSGGGGYLSADVENNFPAIPAGCSTDGMSYAVLQEIVELEPPTDS